MVTEERKEECTEEAPPAEQVSKADYDMLAKEYKRLADAFNKAISLLANNYADTLAKSIFDEVDKASK